MAAARNKPSFGTRAWRLLRLAVLWARKGGAAHSLRLRLLRTLRRHGARGDRLRHGGEREYSIDETPAFRFRTPSARVLRLIPCIAPATPGLCADDRYFFSSAASGEVDEAAGRYWYGDDPRSARHVEEEEDELSCCGDDEQLLERVVAEACRASTTAGSVAGEGGEDAGVDVKAEEFIARFYAQMKLQRQISWLQYNEMMERSIS
uniref:Long cell-linked locus protein n=1 Tax=Zea mays TaxID=4577 RepID=B6SJT6_MAIZE|nr:long cell-linked locus protein [Zea mays]